MTTACCRRRFKILRILRILSGKNVNKIKFLNAIWYPFTGEMVPVYRRNGTRLQEKWYPFTGEMVPVYRKTYKVLI